MYFLRSFYPVALDKLVGHIHCIDHNHLPSEFELFSTNVDGKVDHFLFETVGVNDHYAVCSLEEEVSCC